MAPQQVNVLSSIDVAATEQSPILEATRHLLKPNGSIIGRQVAETIHPLFPTFASAIPPSDRPALASIDGRSPISHSRIVDFVERFGPMLHKLGFGSTNRIALILPNGPELALAIVAVAHWASCVPLSANGAASELEADLLRAGVDLVIGPYSGLIQSEAVDGDDRFRVMSSNSSDNGWTVFAGIEESAKRLNIPFVGLVPSPQESGIFRLAATKSPTSIRFADCSMDKLPRLRTSGVVLAEPNSVDKEVLVLFTSGTTGNKKLVPHILGDMLTAATTIALSWNLTTDDVNCNLMPLFHVGGIVRQVFSPIVSGGCVICCPSFDPSIFWNLLSKQAFSWYYAAPTMHQMILQTGKMDGYVNEQGDCQYELRMIANAAGGLLPSLAVQLRKAFGANVLPSYGMVSAISSDLEYVRMLSDIPHTPCALDSDRVHAYLVATGNLSAREAWNIWCCCRSGSCHSEHCDDGATTTRRRRADLRSRGSLLPWIRTNC